MAVSLIHNEDHALLIVQSYERLLGQPLLTPKHDLSLSEQLFLAEFAVLSHNSAADPVFNYANRQALALFELNETQLTQMPSRLSAEPVNQQQREALLDQVRSQGYISNYSGVRISRTGKRFRIHQAVVWNLVDENGCYQGQAACFSEWSPIE
ncbi:MAG: MEKHLA domain-containing protein [Methylococcaceae bacterium]|nr:MEKHLA domain-containing protein [Methylococcaceae bacterium]